MNDRFKFRAWNKEEKQLYYDAEDTYDCLTGKPYPIGASYFGCLLYKENWIVEQCTGLKDKNGELIYEGDIVIDGFNMFVVEWYKEMAQFVARFRDEKHLYTVFYPDAANTKYEVLGNIHENKELLDE